MKRFLLYMMILIMTLSLTACGGGMTSAPSSAASAAPSPPRYEENSAETDAGGSYLSDDSEEFALPLLTPGNADGISLVYTVELELQTTSFEEGTRKLLNSVSEMKGYLESAYIRGRDMFDTETARYAQYLVRVPSERLAEFLVIMEDNYNLYSLNQNSQDITVRKQETDLRLEDLREQEEVLRQALQAAKTAEETIELERELEYVQTEISKRAAAKTEMDHDVIYSTVTIYLYEVIPPVEAEILPYGERLGQTIQNSGASFAAMGQNFLLFVIASLPAVVVLAVIFGIVLLLYRRRKKRSSVNHSSKEEGNPD